MIVLWLLVTHLVGDYLFQTRWQANGKFGWTDEAIGLRMRHVGGYTAAFVPAAVVWGWHQSGHATASGTAGFLFTLAIAHFFTDAQRFTRTPGEWVWWQIADRPNPDAVIRPGMTIEEVQAAFAAPLYAPLPPNPWPPIGLAIDQTLHLIQIAVLADLFLT